MDKFLKEKSHQQDQSPNKVMMEKEPPKNISVDVRAENAPINIKNLNN